MSMTKAAVIETERLLLREWRKGDAGQLNRHCNTPEVMRWLGGVQTRAELNDDVEYFQDCQEEDGHTFWVMECKSDGAFLGFCGFVVVPDADGTIEGELEIGWRLRQDEWRKGYAEEAAIACLQYAFKILGAKRVVSRAAAGNVPSQALMKKLGMQHRSELDYDPDDGSGHLLVFVCEGERSVVALREHVVSPDDRRS